MKKTIIVLFLFLASSIFWLQAFFSEQDENIIDRQKVLRAQIEEVSASLDYLGSKEKNCREIFDSSYVPAIEDDKSEAMAFGIASLDVEGVLERYRSDCRSSWFELDSDILKFKVAGFTSALSKNDNLSGLFLRVIPTSHLPGKSSEIESSKLYHVLVKSMAPIRKWKEASLDLSQIKDSNSRFYARFEIVPNFKKEGESLSPYWVSASLPIRENLINLDVFRLKTLDFIKFRDFLSQSNAAKTFFEKSIFSIFILALSLLFFLRAFLFPLGDSATFLSVFFRYLLVLFLVQIPKIFPYYFFSNYEHDFFVCRVYWLISSILLHSLTSSVIFFVILKISKRFSYNSLTASYLAPLILLSGVFSHLFEFSNNSELLHETTFALGGLVFYLIYSCYLSYLCDVEEKFKFVFAIILSLLGISYYSEIFVIPFVGILFNFLDVKSKDGEGAFDWLKDIFMLAQKKWQDAISQYLYLIICSLCFFYFNVASSGIKSAIFEESTANFFRQLLNLPFVMHFLRVLGFLFLNDYSKAIHLLPSYLDGNQSLSIFLIFISTTLLSVLLLVYFIRSFRSQLVDVKFWDFGVTVYVVISLLMLSLKSYEPLNFIEFDKYQYPFFIGTIIILLPLFSLLLKWAEASKSGFTRFAQKHSSNILIILHLFAQLSIY